MKSKLNKMLYADGTGNSGKDFLGLAALIGAGGTYVGGIDATDAANVYWRSVVGSPVPAPRRPTCCRRSTGHCLQRGVQRQRRHRRHLRRPGSSTRPYEPTAAPRTSATRHQVGQRRVHQPDDQAGPDLLGSGLPGRNGVRPQLQVHHPRRAQPALVQAVAVLRRTVGCQAGGNATTVDARYSIITTYGNLTVRNRASALRHASAFPPRQRDPRGTFSPEVEWGRTICRDGDRDCPHPTRATA